MPPLSLLCLLSGIDWMSVIRPYIKADDKSPAIVSSCCGYAFCWLHLCNHHTVSIMFTCLYSSLICCSLSPHTLLHLCALLPAFTVLTLLSKVGQCRFVIFFLSHHSFTYRCTGCSMLLCLQNVEQMNVSLLLYRFFQYSSNVLLQRMKIHLLTCRQYGKTTDSIS